MNRSRDIEKDPGPKTKSCQSFSICHWNLNSILPTISLKCRYCRLTTLFKSMMLFAFGNLLNSSIPYDDDNLEIPGYNLIGVDHPSEDKRAGVCVYYENTLSLKVLDTHIY